MQQRTSHKHKPKICLVVTTFPKLSETFIVNKFLGLIEKGWNVHLVCDTSKPEGWNLYPRLSQARIQKRVHIRWRHRPRWLAALLTPFSLLRCLLMAPSQTLRYLRYGWPKFGLDTLRRAYLDAEFILLQPALIHFEFGALAVERMYLGELLNCRLVVSYRGYDLNYAGLEGPVYYQPVWDKADALHLLSQALWQRAQERGCPADKPHVLIPPAIDIMAFSNAIENKKLEILGSLEHPLRILSVGRLEWEKGYEFALQAVKLLQEQGLYCQYRILGGGDYVGALAYACHQLGLDDVVDFLGDQPQTEVQRQMNWADVFLHAAVSEGFGNAVLEAQAMQLPVVCSDAGGLGENIQQGVSGFVLPRRNPQALAEELKQLALKPHLRQNMGEAGRKRVEENFQVNKQIHRYYNFYSKVLNSDLISEAYDNELCI